MIRFCSFWQEEEESELEGAEPWPLTLSDGRQHTSYTVTGCLLLPPSRVIFLTMFPCLDIVLISVVLQHKIREMIFCSFTIRN